MAKLSRELKAKGISLVDLSLGEPDFQTPDHIKEAAKRALDEGYTKYPPVAGFPELREAICKKLERDNQLHYQPEETMVSTGAKQVLANVILSLINEGDEVIIPMPYWVTYSALVSLAGGTSVFVPCGIDDGFKLSAEKLKAAITPRTRMFIFSSPCNPSGAVYSRNELKALAEVFEQHPEITIVSDEIYEYINYTGKHESIAQFTSIKDQVVIVNGFSKGFAMTGWRLGYMAGSAALVKACDKLQSQFTSGANSITQRAAITALTEDITPSRQMTQAFKERRDYFINALANIPGVKVTMPEGAFYAFPDLSSFFGRSFDGHTVQNADEMAMYLLNVAHVTGVAGSAFGEDHCVRFSFAASLSVLEEGIKRIETALAALK